MSISGEATVERVSPAPKRSKTTPQRRAGRRWDLEPVALPVTWIAVIVLFAILMPGVFLTQANISSILSSQAVLVVVTLAVVIPFTVGDLDVSVGSVVGLSAMLTAILNVQHGVTAWIAVLIAIVVSAAIGLFNGIVATRMNVDLLIVTLGTGSVITGITAWISHQATVAGVSQGLVDAVVGYRILGIAPEFYYAMIIAVVLFYLLHYTPFGRRMLIVGQARDVATLSGIKVNRVRVTGLVLCSALAGFAGVLYVGTSGSAMPTGGAELLLPAFAAAFLGATSIVPGRFNVFGSVIAVYFLVTGINGLQLLGAQTYVQQLFYGGALVVAVSVSSVVRERRRRRGTAQAELAMEIDTAAKEAIK
ncbi:ABC transporter permease [Rhodococcus sp. T7]|uniref:ABC transporter permease n=1 Tax=Rhodococcus sp. T7 TaxID=627444 RepID=UPI0013C7B0A9|nr:ABC transporter permease [Rhodococcus sp. T7]KAF0957164.1 D-allose transport system permease protein AlsC [Rhodococcus sp. T7]KAF0959002.1 D-allose transport system permease protein AlsC [Rhodococcus sp. T7]